MVNNAESWRGFDGEEAMTEEDWMKRGGDQARAMLNGLDAFMSSPDEDGVPTGGCYNGDYPQSWHDTCNSQLSSDEYYEAQVDGQLRELNHYKKDS